VSCSRRSERREQGEARALPSLHLKHQYLCTGNRMATGIAQTSRNSDMLTKTHVGASPKASRSAPALSPPPLAELHSSYQASLKVRFDAYWKGQLHLLSVRSAVRRAFVSGTIARAGAELIRSVEKTLVVQVGGKMASRNLGRKWKPSLRPAPPHLDFPRRYTRDWVGGANGDARRVCSLLCLERKLRRLLIEAKDYRLTSRLWILVPGLIPKPKTSHVFAGPR
jgi:hypothetical protein